MEEKERYRYIVATNKLYDSQEDELYFYNINSNKVISILNQQDKRIKELELLLRADKKMETCTLKAFEKLKQENQQLKQQLAEKKGKIETILKENEELVVKYNVYNYGDKIQQDKAYSITGKALDLLINRQNQKAIELLEKLKEKFDYCPYSGDKIYLGEVCEIIDNQITELGGGENE